MQYVKSNWKSGQNSLYIKIKKLADQNPLTQFDA